jgi:hypothetical protein
MRRVTELDTISLDEIRALAAKRFGDSSTGPSLQKYFDQFALAARRAHLAGRVFEQ